MAHNCYIEPFHGICCSCGGSLAKDRCDVIPDGHCTHWHLGHLARGVLKPLLVVPLLPGQTQAQADADDIALMEAMIEAED